MERKLFLVGEGGYIFVDPEKDFNTEFGIISASDLKNAKPGKSIKTHKGSVFYVCEPNNIDLLKKMIRLPQIITPKDMGSIIMYGGVKSNSKILDAGTGSGFAACILSGIASAGKVISYEQRKDFARVAEKNKTFFGADNLKIVNSDIKSGVKEKNFDFALLDLPDPDEILPGISKNLKVGATVCCYLPSIIQIQKTIKSLPACMKISRLIQNLETDWKVDMDRNILRPESSGIMHTAFLLFVRKVSE